MSEKIDTSRSAPIEDTIEGSVSPLYPLLDYLGDSTGGKLTPPQLQALLRRNWDRSFLFHTEGKKIPITPTPRIVLSPEITGLSEELKLGVLDIRIPCAPGAPLFTTSTQPPAPSPLRPEDFHSEEKERCSYLRLGDHNTFCSRDEKNGPDRLILDDQLWEVERCYRDPIDEESAKGADYYNNEYNKDRSGFLVLKNPTTGEQRVYVLDYPFLLSIRRCDAPLSPAETTWAALGSEENGCALVNPLYHTRDKNIPKPLGEFPPSAETSSIETLSVPGLCCGICVDTKYLFGNFIVRIEKIYPSSEKQDHSLGIAALRFRDTHQVKYFEITVKFLRCLQRLDSLRDHAVESYPFRDEK